MSVQTFTYLGGSPPSLPPGYSGPGNVKFTYLEYDDGDPHGDFEGNDLFTFITGYVAPSAEFTFLADTELSLRVMVAAYLNVIDLGVVT